MDYMLNCIICNLVSQFNSVGKTNMIIFAIL
jgi:hypothetical protein